MWILKHSLDRCHYTLISGGKQIFLMQLCSTWKLMWNSCYEIKVKYFKEQLLASVRSSATALGPCSEIKSMEQLPPSSAHVVQNDDHAVNKWTDPPQWALLCSASLSSPILDPALCLTHAPHQSLKGTWHKILLWLSSQKKSDTGGTDCILNVEIKRRINFVC